MLNIYYPYAHIKQTKNWKLYLYKPVLQPLIGDLYIWIFFILGKRCFGCLDTLDWICQGHLHPPYVKMVKIIVVKSIKIFSTIINWTASYGCTSPKYKTNNPELVLSYNSTQDFLTGSDTSGGFASFFYPLQGTFP